MTTTTEPFVLDMSTLTQEQLDRALPHLGACSYSAPCIIGAMMPEELVEKLKADGRDGVGLNRLAMKEYVTFSNKDAPLLRKVQRAFDGCRLRDLQALLPHLNVYDAGEVQS